jgi:hypothetical protein
MGSRGGKVVIRKSEDRGKPEPSTWLESWFTFKYGLVIVNVGGPTWNHSRFILIYLRFLQEEADAIGWNSVLMDTMEVFLLGAHCTY